MKPQFTSALAQDKHKAKLAILKDKVYALIQSAGLDGITNKEISAILNVDASTVSGRVRPLVIDGLVRQCQKRYCKITGNLVIAWEAKTLPSTLF